MISSHSSSSSSSLSIAECDQIKSRVTETLPVTQKELGVRFFSSSSAISFSPGNTTTTTLKAIAPHLPLPTSR